MSSMPATYPVTVEIDGPQPQNRLAVLFRFILIIPAAIVARIIQMAGQVVWLISWFVIVATGRYPEGMLRFSIGAVRWTTLVSAYGILLTGKYPPFALGETDYPIRIHIEERVDGRNRLTTFWPIRVLLAVPHILILSVLGIAAFFVLLAAWIAAIFTGIVPLGMHNFLAGVTRWTTRVSAYIMNLVDEYPPFTMN